MDKKMKDGLADVLIDYSEEVIGLDEAIKQIMEVGRMAIPMVGDQNRWDRICDWLQVNEDEVAMWADNDGTAVYETQENGTEHLIVEWYEASNLILWHDAQVMQTYEEEEPGMIEAD